MADHARQVAVDVIAAGREPPDHRARLRGHLRLVAIAEAVALAGLVAVTLHYRAEAGRPRPGGPAAVSQPVSALLPEMTSNAFRLPRGEGIAGTVVITAAVAQPRADRAQFTVSALITGGSPDTVYDLTGNDCSSGLPDHVWATGFTDSAGTAELTGHAWTGAVADRYWLAIQPSTAGAPAGLRGRFAQGTASPFPAGQAPCAPAP